MRAHRKLGIYCPAEQLLTSQKSLNTTVLVGWLVNQSVGQSMDREMDRQTDSSLVSESFNLPVYLLVH